jgi:hypothetical protein
MPLGVEVLSWTDTSESARDARFALGGPVMTMLDRIRREILQGYYQEHYPNDGQRFLAWYLRNIHLCDPVEARYDITDGPDDRQIDAIHIDDDTQTAYVIQGKFLGADTVGGEPLREVLSSWAQLRDLVHLQEIGNERLQCKLADLAAVLDDDYEVAFELITTATLTEHAQTDLATFQRLLAESDDLTASINVVDSQELKRRYELALDQENPVLTHCVHLEGGKWLDLTIGGTRAVFAAVQLRDCLDFPGIKDGTLFRKNVRQSLGLSNPVNKGIRATIYGDKHRDFLFFHNGITAICNRMALSAQGSLQLQGLSVVNGCQSLHTVLSCSERVKQIDDTYVMFRFYEIPQRERADRISISTNSQSAVKPRDLRSNDKRVISLKRAFEQRYPHGCFVTKRGEAAPADRDTTQVLDLSDLGKYLISWHSQRPNAAYSETKIFDKYFEQLFRREYPPEDAQSLNLWMQRILLGWTPANLFNLNESLLAMKAYAPYHQLYAVSMCFAITSGFQEMVPSPTAAYDAAAQVGQTDQIVKIAAACLNTALVAAANEPQPANRVFSPQNWIKSKTCLSAINAATRQYFDMLSTLPMPGAPELATTLRDVLTLGRERFDYRWAAD